METTNLDINDGFKAKEDIQAFSETTTITQTIEIPVDHRVFFEFIAPKEIPVGKARVELKVTPVAEQESIPISKSNKSQGTPLTDSLAGILSNNPTPRANRLLGVAADLGDITLEEIRAERLRKYLL